MINAAFPTDVALARMRRSGVIVLVLALSVLIVSLIADPRPVSYVLANVALGIVFALFSARDPVPVVASWRWILGGMAFVFVWSFLRRTLLHPGPEDFAGLGLGLSAAITGMATVWLWTAPRMLQRQQRWWQQQGPGLTGALTPEATTYRERFRQDSRVQARILGSVKLRLLFVLAWIMLVAGVCGLFIGLGLPGLLLLGIGLASVSFLGYLLRLSGESRTLSSDLQTGRVSGE